MPSQSLLETKVYFSNHARSTGMATDCCRFLNPGTFISGSQSTLHLWTHLKKKPIFSVQNAHGDPEGGPGCLNEIEASWIQSISACRGADIVVRC